MSRESIFIAATEFLINCAYGGCNLLILLIIKSPNSPPSSEIFSFPNLIFFSSIRFSYLTLDNKSTTGLETKILQTGTGKKPTDGSTIYIHYAGYLEDGSLFDSSYEEVNKVYGKFDANRASQNGYQPFPFEAGKKDGLIPGFLEGISNLSFGDKALLFIPSNLGYGERGAGNVIPPNSNIIFEVELFETIPTAEPKK